MPPLQSRVRLRARRNIALPPFVAAICLAAAGVRAQPAPASPPTDPVLRALIDETLRNLPEVRAADARVAAAKERAPQAGALADPMLTVGIQNDSFRRIEIGRMEMSYVSIMASQALPWPGKRGLRTEAAELGAKAISARAARARLAAEANVRRAYLDLLLTRERRALLDRLAQLWSQSEAAARARYESGEGPQSDVLRAQLERARVEQRRLAFDAQETGFVQQLNRLRGHPLDEAVASGSALRELPLPGESTDQQAELADALARSPELEEARSATQQGDRIVQLAHTSLYPDFVVGAGVMPRGGDFEPMWQATVGVTLPVYAGSKQNRAIDEAAAELDAATRSSEAIHQRVELRVRQRQAQLRAVSKVLALYRDGLLVQSKATVESTLAQYAVGRVTFASVLDAVGGYINDEDAFLQSAADAQRLLIARQEVSLEQPSSAAIGAMSAASSAAEPQMPPNDATPAAASGM